MKRRHLLYLLAALAVPLPASAVMSSDAPAAPSLSVSVSLDSCGVASTTVVCKLDATFAPIEGARYYSAAVTGPDGSVVDYGDVPSGAASLWVPYVGNGTYTVTVSAWGEPTKYEKPKPIATDSASAGDGGGAVSRTSTPGNKQSGSDVGKSSSSDSAGTVSADNVGNAPGTGSSSGDSASVDGSSDSVGTYSPDEDCTPIPADPPPPSDPATPASDGSGINGVSAGDAQSLEQSGVLPSDTTTADCPDPQTTPDGTCCPTPAG
jgi:hypothetical protein